MAELGDFEAARRELTEVLATDRRNAALRFNLAMVVEALGEIEAAAVHYSVALRLQPKFAEAARRLTRLLARFKIEDPATLDPAGLEAALAVHGIAHQPIAETIVAVAFFHDDTLAGLMREFATGGDAGEIARRLVVSRTHEGLKPSGLHAALMRGVVRSTAVERLLTAVRRALLLDTPRARFEDRNLYAFALALMQAAANGDYAWAETAEETAALAAIAIDTGQLGAGDLEMSHRLLLAAMYRPVGAVLGRGADAVRDRIRPKPLREVLAPRLAAESEERSIAAALPRLRPIADAISQRVATQYERSTYPRWTSAQIASPGGLKPTLRKFFSEGSLAQLDRPYEVLIAGAGTGQQVIQSAWALGPHARVLAIDLSAASLAYAKRMAAAYGITNVEFMVADILDLGRLGRLFQVIECVGVLHHMADVWAGWRALLDRLAPGGLAYIALYSAISRANLRRLRAEPGYPGPGCSDNAARAYRAELMARPAGAPGTELLHSRNFFSLHEFRDLALHASEQHVSLGDIAGFLSEHRLRFAGFTLEPQIIERFHAFAGTPERPGSLADWQRFEEANPHTFDAMYAFWTERLQ